MAVLSPVNLAFQRPLQLAILGVLWREGRLPLSRIERAVCREYKQVATSTISTTLTRLIERGWLERCGKHYEPRITRAEMIAVITAAIEEA